MYGKQTTGTVAGAVLTFVNGDYRKRLRQRQRARWAVTTAMTHPIAASGLRCASWRHRERGQGYFPHYPDLVTACAV
jgi:hypothetical protein